jgi:hypothetical protein
MQQALLPLSPVLPLASRLAWRALCWLLAWQQQAWQRVLRPLLRVL